MEENAPENNRLYAFGPFRLDAGERRLSRGGQTLPLARKVFDLLLVLVAAAGHLKTREELIAALWPKTIVEEHGLSTRVHELRKALGDEGEAAQYIETVRGVGYRFIAPVTLEPQAEPEPADKPAAKPGIARRTRLAGSMSLLGVVVALGVLAWLGFFPPGAREAPAARPSIAVLPFKNLSADAANGYFAAGMQDEILTSLAKVGSFRVISRTSTERYPSQPDNLRDIARELDVGYVLEGSVQKAGEQVHINVQLIDTHTLGHVWARSYTRKLDDIFGVEGQVATEIAAALDTKLTAPEKMRLAAKPTTNPAALDLFLRAEYAANKSNSNYEIGDYSGFRAAIPLYRQAVEKDPGFALAWARLSYVESRLAWLGGENVATLNRQARADAEQARELAPHAAATQLALGYCDYYGKRDYAGALKAFQAVLARRPNHSGALAAQGYIERRQGRFKASIASYEKAFSLDPRNSALANEIAITYMWISRYPAAERWSKHALALDPNNLGAKYNYAYAILLSSGDVARALAAASGDAPAMKSLRVSLLTYQRKYRKALALLDTIPATPDNFDLVTGSSKALGQADLYRRLGESAQARPLYEKALSALRPQLVKEEQTHNDYLAGVWLSIADAELGLGHGKEGLDAIAGAQAANATLAARAPDMHTVVTELNARLYAKANRANLAVPLIEKALTMSYIGGSYAPVMLWLDPAWDPIRHDPRFQALLKKYAKYKPAVIYATAAHTTATASD